MGRITRIHRLNRLTQYRGPKDGRYKLAFIEFSDQGSALDTSQRAAALGVIRKAERPLLFVYIHGWHNDANSADVCRFEHFIRCPRWAALTNSAVIFAYHTPTESSRQLSARKEGSGINSEAICVEADSKVKREISQSCGETWQDD